MFGNFGLREISAPAWEAGACGGSVAMLAEAGESAKGEVAGGGRGGGRGVGARLRFGSNRSQTVL